MYVCLLCMSFFWPYVLNNEEWLYLYVCGVTIAASIYGGEDGVYMCMCVRVYMCVCVFASVKSNMLAQI